MSVPGGIVARTLGALVATVAEVAGPELFGALGVFGVDSLHEVLVLFVDVADAWVMCGLVVVCARRVVVHDVAKHRRHQDEGLVAGEFHDELVEGAVIA